MTQRFRLVAKNHFNVDGICKYGVMFPVMNSESFSDYGVIFFSCFLFGVIFFGVIFKQVNQLLFYFFSISVVGIITTISFISPKFSFSFMLLFTTIITVLTLPYEIFRGFSVKQKRLLNSVLNILSKTLILDYLSVVYVKFFCVPSSIFHRRLFLMFLISVAYIITSRLFFIRTITNNASLTNIQLIILYFVLFLGIAIIYLRLLLNASIFFVFSAVRINPTLLSPSILFVLGEDTELPPKSSALGAQPSPSEKKFSLINVSVTRKYYRQFFTSTHTNTFRFIGYGIAICGTAAAFGTLYYTKIQADQATIQAEQAVIQAEQSKQQTYHTAREADVAAVDSGLISRDEYYRRHPEDLKK